MVMKPSALQRTKQKYQHFFIMDGPQPWTIFCFVHGQSMHKIAQLNLHLVFCANSKKSSRMNTQQRPLLGFITISFN